MSAEKNPLWRLPLAIRQGIGPEITVATMMDKSVYDECKPFLIGSVPIISRAMKIMGCDFAIHKIAHPQEARFSWGRWMFWKLATTMRQYRMGQGAETGGANVAGLCDEVDRAGQSGADRRGLYCTNSKEAIKLAGWELPGHTEIYQVETNLITV